MLKLQRLIICVIDICPNFMIIKSIFIYQKSLHVFKNNRNFEAFNFVLEKMSPLFLKPFKN